MYKKFSILLALCFVFLIALMIPQADASAAAVGDYVVDGVVVESDASFCGCCHDHNHGGGFAKLSCFFCKISQFFKNLFGNADEGVEHKYVITESKAATCKADGYESYRCAVCDKSATLAFEKLAHKPIVMQVVKADCTNSGLTEGSKCSVCNTVLVKQNVIPATGHAFDNGIITTQPACEKVGVKTFTCGNCGASKTEAVAALTHEWEDEILQNPTCTTDGERARVCLHCGTAIDSDVISATGHDYDGGQVTTNPGCESLGVRTFTCNSCGNTYTENIPANGHSYDAGVVTTEPKCETVGVLTFTCASCGKTYTDSIAAIGHDYDNGIVTTQPACETTGMKTFTCKNLCGMSYTESVPTLGHNYVGSVTQEATCTEEGIRAFTCKNGCGNTYTESIPALGHIIPSNASVVCYPYDDPKSAGCLTISFACSRCSDPKTGMPYYRIDYTDYKAVIKNAAGVTAYKTTQDALRASQSGDTVVVGVDDVISSDTVVPAGVMLLIPCNNSMQGYTASGYCPDNPEQTGTAKLYRTLTVAESATLTVNGTLLINAVTGRVGGGSVDPYGNSGYYGRIALRGNIVVNSGAVLDCSGYVTDDGGSVTLQKGATMYETYAVGKWRGGSYVSNHPKFSPIYERTMNNLQASLRIESGASLIGSVKMHANDMYYYSRFPQIDNANGIIRLGEGAYVLREIDTVNLRDIYSFYGDISFKETALNVAGHPLTTASAKFFLFDGDMTFNFYDGTIFINQSFAMLPGGVVNLYEVQI